ncbi:hypothetical protein BX600DRAFT_386170 [Xylariales sp. PMI_506]|nr:hypothetical protein BX600DRAFT_386170 [Xylariales sp. PMI_506]
MASNFQVQQPYVLATLPRPLDPTTGRYVVGEVYGTVEGSRKRKRAEVTVGIDGEAVNIYDISSARLVTSYPIPPQATFTCSPSSIRRRVPQSKNIVRYTYVATQDPAQKVTLFKDIVESSGKTTSFTKTISLPSSQPVVYLATRLGETSTTATEPLVAYDEILIVRKNGEIIGAHGDDLQQKWKTTPSILHQDLSHGAKADFSIEFCISVRASEVVDGVFKGSKDALSSLFNGLSPNTDPELLLAISSMSSEEGQVRHLHFLGPMANSQTLGQSNRGLVQLHVVPIPSLSGSSSLSNSEYRLDVRSGSLTELASGMLTVYDITASIPKISFNLELEGATSFLRLSKTSILATTSSTLNVYNVQFRSMQSSAPIELDEKNQSRGRSLVAYFSRLELAIGIYGASLVAIHLDAPKSRTRKRRAEGLLIDSIGRGVSNSKRLAIGSKSRMSTLPGFSNYLPGSMLENYWETWSQEVQQADALLSSEAIEEFEALLAGKFGLGIRGKLTDSVHPAETNGDSPQALPEWEWPEDKSNYPRADRRWVIYSISRAFQWSAAEGEENASAHLACLLPSSNVVSYLVVAGHLTISNVKSALREQLAGVENVDVTLAGEVISRLAELDPTLELLTCYVSATTLGPLELLLAVRTIMRSLELVQDPTQPPPKLLTNGTAEEAETGDIGMELDHLEEEVYKAESILNGNTGVRGSGLSIAFAKLANCPAPSVIKTLQSTLRPEEILSLVYLLRVELVKGFWTSRYLDTTVDEDTEVDAPPDGIIKLIADLLGRCVDAIGPGGWLMNDALLAGDDSGDFIASLKLEVSAALEGLEEAVYLRGVVGEAVKYCEAVQKAEARQQNFNLSRPISLQVKEFGFEALPLGLKSKARVEKTKVVSGGEIVERSTREKGHLYSQQVGPYSLERIVI